MIPKLSLLLALAGGLSAVALPSRNSTQQNACLHVSKLAAQARKANVTDLVTVPGELAYNCLRSMPFDPINGTVFAAEMTKFVQWQSTLEVLQNPPLGYLSPPTNLLGGLEFIEAMALIGEFSNQYEFDQAINLLLATSNDGHLAIETCSSSIFRFMLDLPVVSISTDGVEIPQIYAAADAKLLNSGSSTVSPIIAINGEPAAEAIETLSTLMLLQDPDARYNMMFMSPLRSVADSFPPQGAFAMQQLGWPGRAQYEVEFANGTTIRKPIVAQTDVGFAYTSGQSLLNGACLKTKSSSGSLSPTSSGGSLNTTNPLPSVYPKPLVRDNYNMLSGYYLSEPDLQDVAVLAIPSFEPSEYAMEPTEYAIRATKFVMQAARDGKKKMVIDLSANPGGDVNSGLDMFRLFFPDQDIYQASRMRDHEAFNLAGQALAHLDVTKKADYLACANASGLCIEAFVKPDQTPTQVSHFESWEEIYGPHEQLGGNMSALMGLEWLAKYSVLEAPIRGYGGIPQIPSQRLFEPENILLLTDGLCTSTCTIFAELMKNQGAVKSLVFGGRPRTGPMQAIGGSKGNTAAMLTTILAIGETAYKVAPTAELKNKLYEAFPNPQKIPFQLGGEGGEVNFKSSYRKGEDEVPLQFIYEAADYRRFYTYENIVKPETMWADAARTFWGEGGFVAGSREMGFVSGSPTSD
ncbi:hypothetical protein N7510_011356 [Penicillium lagena]|uniref:uncharacterized protein n=1 Tax=Penicillium lagena TaxID=94218 RepID=UPI002541D748|nr:uncharacterized protein N7510_011356 [Penicillium lagena]KAJ5601822.1 hypothetical protein N7510_011356 [Penicillium lagena]